MNSLKMKSLFSRKIAILALISGIAIVLISYMKNALELEDAEQAYYSQWWRLGYDDQPPLYTWLQIIFNDIFGLRKLSFSLLRALIFSGILIVLHQFAKEFHKTSKATLVVLTLVLIPTFIDFTFRRLSHTALLCLAIIATYWYLHKLFWKKSILNYAVWGLIIGIGLLSKYNYALVLLALALALPFDASLRKVIFNAKIGLTSVIVLLLVTPHFYTLFSQMEMLSELQTSIDIKTAKNTAKTVPVISPLWSFIQTSIKLFLPLSLLIGISIWMGKIKLQSPVKRSWLFKMLVSQTVVLLIVFMVMDIHKVEARWLLPLFLPFLALLPSYLQFNSRTLWERYGFYVFLTILFLQTVRTPVEKLLEIPSSVHFGFHPISEKLQQGYPQKQWMLPNVTYGGNIRLLNPDIEVFSLDDYSLPPKKLQAKNRVIVSDTAALPQEINTAQLVDSIPNFGKERVHLYFYGF